MADHAAGHVTVTNVNDVSFTVSWITASVVTGQVEWSATAGDLPGSGTTVNDERGAISDDTHTVAIGGLTAETTYFFDVISGGVRDDNGGAHYQVAPPLTLPPPGTDTAVGAVKRQDSSNADGCLVYFTITKGGNDSQVISHYVSDLGGGNFFYNAFFGGLRTPSLTAYFGPAAGDTVVITAQCGGDGVGSVNTTYGTLTSAPPDVNVAPLPT